MSSVIKVNACVYSRIGYGREQNTNSFYMNGKFMSEQHIENVQASMENRGTEYLFAVADNLDCSDDDNDVHVSILKEISRFHEKITVNGGDLRFKIKELESRVTDAGRLVSSYLEMNRVPSSDTRWDLGFGSVLISDGQFVAANSGNTKVFMMRDGMFRPLASEAAKAKQMLDARISSGEEAEEDDIVLPDEDPSSMVVVSDIYDLSEGDSFLICSNGLLEAIGEEKIEDLLSLRSDSSYIAFRLVDEAMKRNSTGDITAMVIQVEKMYESAGGRKLSPKSENVKNRVDRLNKAPTVTYKYSRKKQGKYQGTATVVLTVVTILAIIGIMYMIVSSMINTGKDRLAKDSSSPTTSAKATPSDRPTSTPDDIISPTVTPPDEEPTPTPTPTPDSTEVRIHVVVKGDTMSGIARKYYGSADYARKLCDYNNIENPDKIILGQKIKIPPLQELQ
jgi:serine/threonine protein phosphatase PrpC/LysM repeat protein